MPNYEDHYESNFIFDEDEIIDDEDYTGEIQSIIADIIADEYDIQNDDKQHLKYYIGVCMEDDDGSLLLGTSISLQTFFRYDIEYIERYLDYDNAPNEIVIMQLHISNELVYNVVLKTFWLKIVQRTWKRIFNQRQKIIQIRKSVYVQEYFRLNGRYPIQAFYLPEYYGIIR
jgi:hypothetical protein